MEIYQNHKKEEKTKEPTKQVEILKDPIVEEAIKKELVEEAIDNNEDIIELLKKKILELEAKLA